MTAALTTMNYCQMSCVVFTPNPLLTEPIVSDSGPIDSAVFLKWLRNRPIPYILTIPIFKEGLN